MNVSRSLPKLNASTLLVFLITVVTVPSAGLAQDAVDALGELGYQSTYLGMVEVDGELCRRLQLDNVPGIEMPFPRMIMLVRVTDNYPLQVEYYDDQGRNIKTLQTQSIERINGVPVSMKMTMKNHLDSTETSLDLTINYEE